MGRFASTVEFYARYREPYPPEFFKKSAEQIALRGNESLLDVGCGPGLLAIGFAPFVGRHLMWFTSLNLRVDLSSVQSIDLMELIGLPDNRDHPGRKKSARWAFLRGSSRKRLSRLESCVT